MLQRLLMLLWGELLYFGSEFRDCFVAWKVYEGSRKYSRGGELGKRCVLLTDVLHGLWNILQRGCGYKAPRYDSLLHVRVLLSEPFVCSSQAFVLTCSLSPMAIGLIGYEPSMLTLSAFNPLISFYW